jgi:hypothetical protein
MISKQAFKKLLNNKTKCIIQHTGWPCGTCFFAISKKLTNKDWQAVLFFRGDYKREELDNLPKDIDKQLERIVKIVSSN